MARQRRTSTDQSMFSNDDLTYLAGIFDVTWGFKGDDQRAAVQVWNTRARNKYGAVYAELMAETFGGEHGLKKFGEKEMYHWTLPLERRLELFLLLDASNKIRSLDVTDRLTFRKRLERGLNPEGKDTD